MARKKLVNKEELFNFYDSSLCSIIKKIFKVTKLHFQIFKSASKYNFTI